MVREKDNPDAKGDLLNFIDKTIACAPLKGDYYEADWHTVHQALVSFTSGNPSEDWLKANLNYRDGRISTKALRNNLQENLMPPGTFMNQSDSTTISIIRMKGQRYFNSFSPSARICKTSLKKKAIQWSRMIKPVLYLNLQGKCHKIQQLII